MKPIFPEHMNQNDAELITSYLQGELNTDEKISVEERRKSDVAFNDLFEAHLKLAAATRLSNLDSKLNMLKEYARPDKIGQPSVFPQTKVIALNRRQWIMRFAAAAVMLILVAIGVRTLIPQAHDRIFEAHFSNTILPGKGELSAAVPIEQRQAFDHYAREEYTNAAKEFDKLMAAHTDKDYLLYAAVSHLGAGHLERAAAILDRFMSEYADHNRTEVLLLRALVMVRRGDLSEAIVMLEANTPLIQESRDLERLYEDLKKTER